jgi:TatD DNase family protein
MSKYIDIHAHLNFAVYDEDRDEVIDRTLSNNVSVINVGTQRDTSKKAVDIAEKYNRIYAIVGLHPVHLEKTFHDVDELGPETKGFVSRGEVFEPSYYKSLCISPKIVAIGECGLDYFRNEKHSIVKQKQVFEQQIVLANEVGKPLMLHIRNNPKDNYIDAYDDVYEILKSVSKVRANLHFFAGTIEQARRFLDLGCTISFNGVITFTKDYDELVKYVPSDSIMSETDCPYLTPVPYRGKRNEPLNVREVIQRMAGVRKVDIDDMSRDILDNAGRFFNIDFSK